MKSTICVRLSDGQRASVIEYLGAVRKRTGENASLSDLIRRCLDIGLRDHHAELTKGDV